MKKVCENTHVLLTELTKKKPNLALVRESSQALGLPYDGDLTKTMALLLAHIDGVRGPVRKGKKGREMESL